MLAGPFEQVLKTVPILIVPLVQIILAVGQSFERIYLKTLVLPVAHCIANIVAAYACQQVQMFLQIRNLKKIVIF